MSKDSGSKTQKVVQTTQLPAYIEAAGQDNVALANSIAARPYQTNPYQRVAGFSQPQMAAFQGIVNQQGAYKPWMMGAAQPGMQIATAQNPALAGISAYMNPYENQVVGNAMNDLNRGRQLAIGQTADAAHAAGAFGGDRHGVAEAETNRAYAEQQANMAAAMRQQGWNTALGASQNDIQSRLAAAGQLGQLATSGQAMDYQDLAALEGVGRNIQGQDQAEGDLQAGQWQQAWNYPIDMLNLKTAALGATPYSQTTTSTQPLYRNTASSALGGAMAGAGLASSLGVSGPWGWGLAGLGGLAGAFL